MDCAHVGGAKEGLAEATRKYGQDYARWGTPARDEHEASLPDTFAKVYHLHLGETVIAAINSLADDDNIAIAPQKVELTPQSAGVQDFGR